ncbi:LOW QUALITY PROTEIN: exportin-2 [Nilaparvata lugens]|uniref:LOW QUALITY PROTEIN: exportin-2 n=1 Tax=Nilaparvata lugens TaxID=108931 RepID=UPI00193CD675|nr:LOW QUALITY PROTEIN: exportin-2 [Nilaparvata lugens]
MELSDENLRTLSDYLQKTLNPQIDIRRPAEKFLESVEVNKNYPILLLHLINKPEIDITIRISGAVAFKNFIKRNWSLKNGGTDRIHGDDRQLIKATILDMMLSAPESIQRQLSDAIAIIGKHDFPDQWTNLIDDMVSKFASGDFHIINGILRTAHSIFKRYRFEFKSQALWTEIKFVLDKFAQPLTELFEATVQLTVAHANNPEALKVIYSSLMIICKIFYSLNFQDLPEYFEDNMKTWMVHFRNLLTVDVKCLQTGDDEEPGIIEQLRSQVCSNVSMYALKYDEEFQSFLPDFVTDIWNLLISTGKQHKYDSLVSNALQFLATVADRTQYRHLFEQPEVLSSICEKVVIPNMEFRPSDEELFEDNPEEYIRRDIEGSDIDTRRRSACDLVKVLSKYFEEKMLSIFGQYVQAMLQQYDANPGTCWRQKDAALYLVTSLTNKGQTQKHGVTQATSLVNLSDFTAQHILPELNKPDVNSIPVIKADAIKYLMMFRSVLPGSVVVGALPQLVRHLAARSQVVHTYAAATIEKALVLRDPGNGEAVVSAALLGPLATDLLQGLFSTLEGSGIENEYVMKAIMRSFTVLQEAVIPLLGELLPKLTEMLKAVSRNPSKPHFNHYLFETLVLSIRIVCKSTPAASVMKDSRPQTQIDQVKERLNEKEQVFLQEGGRNAIHAWSRPTTQGIHMPDDVHFRHTAFSLSSKAAPTDAHRLSRRRSSSLAANRLRKSSLSRSSSSVCAMRPCVSMATEKTLSVSVNDEQDDGRLPIMLSLLLELHNESGVPEVYTALYPCLLSPLLWDRPGNVRPLVRLLLAFVRKASPNQMDTVFPLSGLLGVFQKLIASRANDHEGFYLMQCLIEQCPRFVSVLIYFKLCLNRMFRMIVERLIIPDAQKISGTVEVKIAAVGLTKLLCESTELIDGAYSEYWSQLLNVVIRLFEQPEDDSLHADDHFIQVDDTPGYEAAFAQLAYAPKGQHDPLSSITDARLNLAQSLSKLSSMYPGRLNGMLQQGLGDAERQCILKYLQAANVQIA